LKIAVLVFDPRLGPPDAAIITRVPQIKLSLAHVFLRFLFITIFELEKLELVQSHMAQKSVLRGDPQVITILASFCTVPVAVVIESSSKIPLAVSVSCAVFFRFSCGNRAMDRRSAMVLLNSMGVPSVGLCPNEQHPNRIGFIR